MPSRLDEIRVDDRDLARFHGGASLADRAHALHLQQRETALERIPCRCVVLEADDRKALAGQCARLLAILGELEDAEEEAMVNIVVLYDKGWRVVVIPRARHRPSCYAAEGGEGILLSPASVDLCGVCITPREEDFRRIGREQIAAIFDEVCLGGDDMRELKERFRGDTSGRGGGNQ